MLSIAKRVAGLGAVAALIAAAAPVSGAGAATFPTPVPIAAPAVTFAGPVGGAYQAGIDAAVGGWNAGADAAVGGWNAGAAALGLPFQFSQQSVGSLGVHRIGLSPLIP
jgi:hypothetical protein